MLNKRILNLNPFEVEIESQENININNHLDKIKYMINKLILSRKLSGNITIMVGIKEIIINWKFI